MLARPGIGYDEHATARRVAESAKHAHSPGRSPFQRDRARVLHSSALRRLAAKTQVVAAGSADFPRTRLTHSLECAQIGRELGAALGCDPDLVDAACLAHDLGHPPFGHNGEAALDQVATGCGGFEGNAQSLRLLTRIEPKVPGAGLNLTRATLDATLKYPWLHGHPVLVRGGTAPSGTLSSGILSSGTLSSGTLSSGDTPGPDGPEPPARPGGAGAKYGCYDEDADVFAWIRDGAPPGRPCLEAQVMDWADDVAYSVHDLEDGLHSGLITLERLRDPGERHQVVLVARAEYCDPVSVSEAELAETFDRLLALSCWPERFDGGSLAVAAVKNLTSELIGRFCSAARRVARAGGTGGDGPFRSHELDLEIPRRMRLECALLKGVTACYVMRRDGAAAAQARERELLIELAAVLAARAPEALDPLFRSSYLSASSDAARLRVVVDQVASLTDTSAIAWHGRLGGRRGDR